MRWALLLFMILIVGCSAPQASEQFSFKPTECYDPLVQTLDGSVLPLFELISEDQKDVFDSYTPPRPNTKTINEIFDIQYWNKNGIMDGFILFHDEEGIPTSGHMQIDLSFHDFTETENIGPLLHKISLDATPSDFVEGVVKGERTLVLPLPEIPIQNFTFKPGSCIGALNTSVQLKEDTLEYEGGLISFVDRFCVDCYESNFVSLRTHQKLNLWKVERDPPTYLFGTIHLSDERILRLPAPVVEAIKSSDVIYVELREEDIDFNELDLYEQPLDEILPPDVYGKLDRYLQSLGFSILLFPPLKIVDIVLMLPSLGIPYSSDNPILDDYVQQLGRAYGKQILGIEDRSNEGGMFNEFTLEEQIQLLNITLDQLDDYGQRDTIEGAIQIYLSGGDIGLVVESSARIPESTELEERFAEALLSDRDHQMASEITSHFESNPEDSLFVAVGVAHYSGDQSIITLLEDEGYTITQVEFEKEESCEPYQLIEEYCYLNYTSRE